MKRSILVVVCAAFVLTACATSENSNARKEESQVAQQQLDNFLKTQPVPSFAWSQLRQTLIEIETAQAEGTASTAFFMSLGNPDPIFTCPAIGFPIPATFQLTNPDQLATTGPRERGTVTVAQLEATGVYTGDTAATNTLCVDDNGNPFAFYHEGPVTLVLAPATWDSSKHQVVLTGLPTGDFTTAQP